MGECIPVKSSWCRNEQVCQLVKCKSLSASNGLDSALYKTYLVLSLSVLRWLALPTQKEVVSLALSTSACEMLLVLKGALHRVEQLLSRIIFNQFWPPLAEGLNKFIYEDVSVSVQATTV